VFSDFYLFESLLGLHAAKLDTRTQEYLVQLQLNHKVRVEEGRLSTLDLSHYA
jgi:putative ATP-binding cassette transporter